MRYRVKFVLEVKNARSEQEAMDIVCDHFSGGDFSGLVRELDSEVEEIHEVTQPEARKT